MPQWPAVERWDGDADSRGQKMLCALGACVRQQKAKAGKEQFRRNASKGT